MIWPPFCLISLSYSFFDFLMSAGEFFSTSLCTIFQITHALKPCLQPRVWFIITVTALCCPNWLVFQMQTCFWLCLFHMCQFCQNKVNLPVVSFDNWKSLVALSFFMCSGLLVWTDISFFHWEFQLCLKFYSRCHVSRAGSTEPSSPRIRDTFSRTARTVGAWCVERGGRGLREALVLAEITSTRSGSWGRSKAAAGINA